MFCVFKQETAYEMRIRDWSSDVCSSDLSAPRGSPSEGELGDERDVVRWLLPASRRAVDTVRLGGARELRAGPDVIQPTPEIRRLPVARTIAPQGEKPIGGGTELATTVYPVVALAPRVQQVAFPRVVADHIELGQRLPPPAFLRRVVC